MNKIRNNETGGVRVTYQDDSVHIVQQHVAANNIEVLNLAQRWILWRRYFVGNIETYLGVHLKFPIFSSDFN